MLWSSVLGPDLSVLYTDKHMQALDINMLVSHESASKALVTPAVVALLARSSSS